MEHPSIIPVARCPVCGEAVGNQPRSCPRCETPHHQECWEYVPGCALFGCAEDTTRNLPVQDWPAAHRLVLQGMRWISAATYSLQAFVALFSVSLAFPFTFDRDAPAWLLLALLAAGAATLASMLGAFTVKWRVQGAGLSEALGETQAEGDRRLARAVAERSGRTLPLPPSVSAALFTLLALVPIQLRADHGPGAEAFAVIFLVLWSILYVALALPARWVGYQRILANRLGAALEAGQAPKQLGPGDPS